MLYAGVDLSRRKLDVHLLEEGGATRELMAISPGRRRPAHPGGTGGSVG